MVEDNKVEAETSPQEAEASVVELFSGDSEPRLFRVPGKEQYSISVVPSSYECACAVKRLAKKQVGIAGTEGTMQINFDDLELETYLCLVRHCIVDFALPGGKRYDPKDIGKNLGVFKRLRHKEAQWVWDCIAEVNPEHARVEQDLIEKLLFNMPMAEQEAEKNAPSDSGNG